MAPAGDATAAPVVARDLSLAQSKFELGVSLILHNWDALSLAVANEWGGPDSADKRDWFAGAVADLFTGQPLSDAEDVQDLLLQIMEDEFEVIVEDGSEAAVAKSVLSVREECGRGEYGTVEAMWERWRNKRGHKEAPRIARVGPQSDDEESVDDEDWDDEDEDEDVEMADVAASRQPKQKAVPEVDEEGFTKVVGKKRR